MKNILLLFLFISISFSAFGQRPNVKNKTIKIQYAALPYNYVEPELRTFSVSGPNTDNIALYGWEFKEEGGTVLLKNQKRGFGVGQSTSDKKVTQTKNKEGEVTKTTTTYFVKSVTTGKWRTTINGPRNELLTERQKERLAEKKAKEEAKKKEEKKEESDNPFLANVEVEEEEEVAANREGYKTYYYNQERKYNYETSKLKTLSAAVAAYKADIDIQVEGFRDEYNSSMRSYAQSQLNRNYGYTPTKASARFKIVGGKKHPEFKNSQDAHAALTVILGKMKFNEPIDQVITESAPVINYYVGLKDKYTGDKKPEKKVRMMALYNLAQYYYYTDQLEKCKEYAQVLIDTKLDKPGGKRFLKDCEDLEKQLAHHKLETRHIILEVDESTLEFAEEEGEEETEEADSGNK